MGVPATSRRRIEIVDYDPTWPALFGEMGGTLRAALGGVALRIDHIGSTAVVGLAAKPIIDVQISVAAFEPIEAFKDPLERLGYVYRANNPERTKRYFREPPGSRRTHIHVRCAGTFSEQFPLLLRDYLRCHAAAAAEFATVKRRLAERFPYDGKGYTDAKNPYVWEIIRRADEWAQLQGWAPGPSDA
ncbi:MAG: GrpB family protein [Streptosporangiales bacterium]|nr:GrpB family protein [Streptosporangiales bacterium]